MSERMSQRATIEIDGVEVVMLPLTAQAGDTDILVGMRLQGPLPYNGHLHGYGEGIEACFPNVVDGVAYRSNLSCDRRMVEVDECIYALWAATPSFTQAVI